MLTRRGAKNIRILPVEHDTDVGDRPGKGLRAVGFALGIGCIALFAYGLFSTPGLIERWGMSWTGAGLLLIWLALAALAIPVMRHGWRPGIVAGLALAALGVRIVLATSSFGRTPSGDALYYPIIAQGLLRGDGLQMYEPYIGSTLKALYPPLYPLLLAGWGAVAGFSTASLLALNLAIDGAAAWMLSRLGTRLGHPPAGRAAAWLYLIWPSVLFSAPLAQKEGLCSLLVLTLASVWLAAIEGRGQRWVRAVPVGVVAGLLALTQPEQAPLALLIGLSLIPLAGWRVVLGIGLRAVTITCLVMLPWWLRNWAVLGAFVPLTSAGQISLWIGNNPDATGNWVPTPPSLRGLPELTFAKAAGALARQWIVDHPGDFIRLTATKLVRATGVGEFGLVRLGAMSPPAPAGSLAWLLPIAQGSHLLLLALSGVGLVLRRYRIPSVLVLLLAASVAQLALFGVWFEFGERHREFMLPFLILAVLTAVGSARKVEFGITFDTGRHPTLIHGSRA